MPQTNLSLPQRIDIAFETLSVPPPYSYEYTFQLQFQASQFTLMYALHYTDRDELSEEEIWEEGFTQDDDYQWQGSLPEVWKTTLLEQWKKTQWLPPEDLRDASENALMLTTTLAEGNQHKGVPQPQTEWEYLLQELTQAVYEAAEREYPLHIRYLDQQHLGEKTILSLTASFLQRSVDIEISQGTRQHRRNHPWSTLAPLLTTMYLLDYQPEHANPKSPTQPGIYLDPGDGLWYAFGTQVTNPGNSDSLAKLSRIFSQLLM